MKKTALKILAAALVLMMLFSFASCTVGAGEEANLKASGYWPVAADWPGTGLSGPSGIANFMSSRMLSVIMTMYLDEFPLPRNYDGYDRYNYNDYNDYSDYYDYFDYFDPYYR